VKNNHATNKKKKKSCVKRSIINDISVIGRTKGGEKKGGVGSENQENIKISRKEIKAKRENMASNQRHNQDDVKTAYNEKHRKAIGKRKASRQKKSTSNRQRDRHQREKTHDKRQSKWQAAGSGKAVMEKKIDIIERHSTW